MKRICAGKWAALACVCALAAGCSSQIQPTNAKLQKALNAYFETHNECLFPSGRNFPFEVDPGPDARHLQTQMDAMKEAGLLKEISNAALHVENYSLTATGERYAPNFCYGHKHVTSVDSFTAPVKDGNVLQTTATYHAVMMDVPVWADTKKMKAAFPDMGRAISSAELGQMVMGTTGTGWVVR